MNSTHTFLSLITLMNQQKVCVVWARVREESMQFKPLSSIPLYLYKYLSRIHSYNTYIVRNTRASA